MIVSVHCGQSEGELVTDRTGDARYTARRDQVNFLNPHAVARCMCRRPLEVVINVSGYTASMVERSITALDVPAFPARNRVRSCVAELLAASADQTAEQF